MKSEKRRNPGRTNDTWETLKWLLVQTEGKKKLKCRGEWYKIRLESWQKLGHAELWKGLNFILKAMRSHWGVLPRRRYNLIYIVRRLHCEKCRRLRVVVEKPEGGGILLKTEWETFKLINDLERNKSVWHVP